jgi:histidine triad (HIT) family protein
MTEKNIFQRIIDKEIPAKIVYEDDQCLALEDIRPQAPVHILVIPKKFIASVDQLQPEDEALVGHMFTVIRSIAAKAGLSDGYRVVANCGPNAGQEVMHLHFHVLGKRPFRWPPG